jgi:dUTP pyrophosphatase
MTIEIEFTNRCPDLPEPARASAHAAGLDLRAAVDDEMLLHPGEWRLIPTGIAVAIPPGYEGQVRPRSGLALKHGVTILNAPGTIDADYRGEIGVILIHHGTVPFPIRRGDRIAQLVIAAVAECALTLVTELPATDRGDGGFGSSGKS